MCTCFLRYLYLAQVKEARPQLLPAAGHDDAFLVRVWLLFVLGFRFTGSSGYQPYRLLIVFLVLLQHNSILSLVWLRGPQKTRARHIDRGRLPDRLRVDRRGLLSRQARRPILSGEASEQVLLRDDAGTRSLPIRNAIRRLFLSFTLAATEGHLGLLTKLRLLQLQQPMIWLC